MALPKIDQPLFPITIPSTGQKTKFRPFTVKEEKILLIAQESKDFEQVVLAVKQIINNCVLNIDIDKIAMVDLEYCLLMIRAKSVGNVIEFKIKDPDTEEEIVLSTDIGAVEVKKSTNESNVVDLENGYSLSMRYPTINDILVLKNQDRSQAENMFDIMINCIDKLISNDGEEVFEMSDFSPKEIEDFVDDLNSLSIQKIKKFFEGAPVLRIEIPYKNSNGEEKKYVLEGVESFFI